MKVKKTLAILLTLAMVFSLFPAVVVSAADETDALSFADATCTVLKPHLDGEEINVYMYEDVYVGSPNREQDQKVAVYVPENATADSAIILYVNNSGWQSNAYAGRNGVENYGWVEKTRMGQTYTTLAGDYVSDSDSDMIGRALADGYVIVSYGCRSRNNGETDGQYLGHSPATMTDTKAVIRYLRYNSDLLPAGDPEKIVVTGTSGGGALSVVIAASGDSVDYYESLYEVGAAGIVKNEDGSYASEISDSVWGTIAYCPITDLGNACAAYEWTWGDTRAQQMEEGIISYGVDAETQNAASAELKAIYEEYVNGLAIDVNADTLEDAIIALMEAEITEAVEEVGIEQMKADLGDATWLTFNEDGTWTYDYEAHKYWVGTQSTFKAASAFSNTGMSAWAGERNEDNLFGSLTDDYSPFNEYSWNHDNTANAVGKDDTGLTWDEFMATEDGARLAKQMKMTSPIEYLLDAEDGESADHWYVRYGMADRDSSFAVETVLYYSLLEDETIDCVNFEFAWLKPHSGNYDVQEAYNWLANELDALTAKDAKVTELNVTVDGKAMSVTKYEDVYCAASNSSDQMAAVFVPENATEDSPVIFMVNNGGWFMNQYSRVENKVEDGAAYSSTSDSDAVGKCLAEGYVILVAGARNRNQGANEAGENLGHSPATMTDSKAAIRWLRYNADLFTCDTEKVVVTGTSGGGALSAILSASGDNSDYYESLYEIGAAGIVKNADGSYSSTISDAIWATIAYCPITDLGNACAAYEWQWADTRYEQIEDGTISYTVSTESMKEATEVLKANYVEYVDSLGLTGLDADSLKDTIIGLMETEIKESIVEYGVEGMQATIAEQGCEKWITVNDDGTFTYDYEAHMYWVGTQSKFKAASAFSNVGMAEWAGNMNEDNLFGGIYDTYSPYNEYSWNNDDTDNEVGYDDTGLTWDEYIKTDAGKELLQQVRMTSGVSYLNDQGDAEVAPYWYVRYGMADRDSSWAVETVLYYSLLNNEDVDWVSFEFAWLKPHAGNYDVQEAYAWLAEVLQAEEPTCMATLQKVTVDGEEVSAEVYNINGSNYIKVRDMAALLNGTDAQFSVAYDKATNVVTIVTGEAYVGDGNELLAGADQSATCIKTLQTVIVDGLEAKVAVYNIGGSNFVKLRDLGAAVGFSVGFDAATNTAVVASK